MAEGRLTRQLKLAMENYGLRRPNLPPIIPAVRREATDSAEMERQIRHGRELVRGGDQRPLLMGDVPVSDIERGRMIELFGPSTPDKFIMNPDGTNRTGLTLSKNESLSDGPMRERKDVSKIARVERRSVPDTRQTIDHELGHVLDSSIAHDREARHYKEAQLWVPPSYSPGKASVFLEPNSNVRSLQKLTDRGEDIAQAEADLKTSEKGGLVNDLRKGFGDYEAYSKRFLSYIDSSDEQSADVQALLFGKPMLMEAQVPKIRSKYFNDVQEDPELRKLMLFFGSAK